MERRQERGRVDAAVQLQQVNADLGAAGLWLVAPQLRRQFHSVFCFAPHSLQVNSTRVSPRAALTRFGAPHLPHLVSMRVSPCVTVIFFFSIASLMRRSVSSRIACFDMPPLLVLPFLRAPSSR